MTVDGVDAVERLILAELQRDGRITTQELARRVGVSETTARRKLKRLTSDDVVQVTGVVNPFHVRFDSPAIVGVTVVRDRLEQVVEQIARHPAVGYVARATGAHHLLVELMATNNQRLADYLMKDFMTIEGVLDTETALILGVYKQSSEWAFAAETAKPPTES